MRITALVVVLLVALHLCASQTATRITSRRELQEYLEYQQFEGEILFPEDEYYSKERNNFAAVKQFYPDAIIYPKSTQDVQKLMKFIHEREDLEFRIRSGGHSGMVYSLIGHETEQEVMEFVRLQVVKYLVLDTYLMDTLQINKQEQYLEVGAGKRLIHVYEYLDQEGYLLPGGSCPTVGISGYTLGGGLGFLGRKYGMGADQVKEIELVNFAGEVIIANKQSNPDLFWALRGAGNGNFGVVTKFKFNLIPFKGHHVTVTYLELPVEPEGDIADFSAKAWTVYQSWSNQLPDDYNTVFWLYPDHIGLHILYLGSSKDQDFIDRLEELKASFYALTANVHIQMDDQSRYATGVLDVMTSFSCKSSKGCPYVVFDRSADSSCCSMKSQYVSKDLSFESMKRIIAQRTKAIENNPGLQYAFYVEQYGGAVSRVKANETAFAFRDSTHLLHAEFCIDSVPSDCPIQFQLPEKALREFFSAVVREVPTRKSYVNYPDAEVNSWPDHLRQATYFGSNVEALREVKLKYDPYNIFEGQL